MDKRRALRQTATPSACEVDRGEAWQNCRAQALEATQIYVNMFATSGAHMISYNINLAHCATNLANCAFIFGFQLRRINTPSDFLQQSNNHIENCFHVLHRYNMTLTHLAKKAMDEISMPIKVNAILAYGVVR
jgi:hypothetical protein